MVESISSVTRRKNGAFASCEPCRKSKVRCDHAQPVCERCRRRGQHLSCTYHLAPLTRKHEAHAVRENSEALSGSNAVLRSPTSHQDCLVLPSQAATSPDMNTELRGMTLSGVANDSGESSDRLRLHRSRENHNALYDERIATIAGTLRHLSDSDRIRVLVTTYYSASQASVIPSSLIIHALPSLSDTLSFTGFNEVTGAQNNKLRGLAETILVATSSRINLGSSLKPADFMALYTGKNLRLEFLGIVCSVAARACLLDQTRGDKRHTDLVQKLYQCSTNCLQLARELTPVNDMLVWLGQDRLMLVSLIEGESSEHTWRGLGELHSDILALGIHRESRNVNSMPFFLSQYRKRVFAKAYYTDKFIATILDRPPRLLKRYSDTTWPLDLGDTKILASAEELEEACQSLTEEGWNRPGTFCASTWARLRYIIAQMLEQILEYNFQPLTTENAAKLRDLLTTNRNIWESLPSHLHYRSQCWTWALHPQICFMLNVVLLGFLQTSLQIFQILAAFDDHSKSELLVVSVDMVSLILELGSFRRKATYMHSRFSNIILFYGLPPATILAKATRDLARYGPRAVHLPPELSRSKLIRSLSDFVAQLKSISGPGESNFDICTHAAKVISESLDDLLNQSPSLPEAVPARPHQTLNSLDIESGMTNFDVVDTIADVDCRIVGDWAQEIDWTSMYDDLTMF